MRVIVWTFTLAVAAILVVVGNAGYVFWHRRQTRQRLEQDARDRTRLAGAAINWPIPAGHKQPWRDKRKESA